MGASNQHRRHGLGPQMGLGPTVSRDATSNSVIGRRMLPGLARRYRRRLVTYECPALERVKKSDVLPQSTQSSQRILRIFFSAVSAVSAVSGFFTGSEGGHYVRIESSAL